MYRFVIAFRYLCSRPIIWISVVGVLLGICSIVVVDSILNGFLAEQRRIIRGSKSDLVLRVPRMLTPDGRLIAPYRELRQQLLANPGVAAAARRLVRPCLFPTDKKMPVVLSLGELSRGPVLQVQGILPAEEKTVSGLIDFLAAAPAERRVTSLEQPFAYEGLPEGVAPIIVGDKMAEVLELQRGDPLELLTFPDQFEFGDGIDPVAETFVLVGTFRTGSYQIDLTSAYLRLEDLQEFAKVPTAAHEIAIRKHAQVDGTALRDQLRLSLAGLGVLPHDVKTWADTEQILLGAVENQRNILNVILFAIIFVAGFNLLVTLNLMIADRLHDIGTLAALGASAPGIASIFTSLGLLVSSLGAGLGLLSGMLLATNITAVHDAIAALIDRPIFTENVYGFREIPSEVDFVRVGAYVLAALISTVIFTVPASLRAGRLNPIEALRRE
jgi:lipoprotein-releasing system permease protein